jgi:hypothetical protein
MDTVDIFNKHPTSRIENDPEQEPQKSAEVSDGDFFSVQLLKSSLIQTTVGETSNDLANKQIQPQKSAGAEIMPKTDESQSLYSTLHCRLPVEGTVVPLIRQLIWHHRRLGIQTAGTQSRCSISPIKGDVHHPIRTAPTH